MLAISMDDAIGVLEICKSYLIALGVILALGVIAIIACMKWFSSPSATAP